MQHLPLTRASWESGSSSVSRASGEVSLRSSFDGPHSRESGASNQANVWSFDAAPAKAPQPEDIVSALRVRGACERAQPTHAAQTVTRNLQDVLLELAGVSEMHAFSALMPRRA